MAIHAQLQDGTVLEFPDGTPDTVIDSTVHSHLSTPEVGVGEDIFRSIESSGVPKGIANLAGAPVDVYNAFANLGAKGGEYIGKGIRSVMGKPDLTPEQEQAIRASVQQDIPQPFLPSSQDVKDAMQKHIAPFYQPQTPYGRYADKIAEYGTGMAAGPAEGLGSRLAVGAGAAIGDETLGEAYKGTPYEGWARLAGSFLGGGGTAFLANTLKSTPATQAKNALEGATPEHFAQAEQLQKDAAAMGSPITSAEAMSQVMGGNPDLMKLQAKAEGTKAGKELITPVIKGRPEANATMITGANQELGSGIADANTMVKLPYDVQKTANSALQNVKDARSAETGWLYNEAQKQSVSPEAVKPILDNIDSKIQEIGATTQGGQELARLRQQITGNMGNLGQLNQVYKEARDTLAKRGDMPGAFGSTVKGVIAPTNSGLGSVLEGQSPELQQANALHAELSHSIVNPVEYGPIGKLANSNPDLKNALSNQWSAVINSQNTTPDKITEAISQMAAHDHSVAQNMAASGLQNEWMKASKLTENGPNVNAGAKWAATVDTPNVKAVFAGLPNGDKAYQGYKKMLTILQAQGQRVDPALLAKEGMTARDLIAAAKSPAATAIAGIHAITGAGDRALAQAMVSPNGVAKLRALAGMNAYSPKADALIRSLIIPKEQGAQSVATPQPNLNSGTPNLNSGSPASPQANRFGNDPAIMNAIKASESGGKPNAKNPMSTASGTYQFTDATWKDMVAKYGKQYGLTMQGKNSPGQQEVAANLYAAENRQVLRNAIGREPTASEIYAAHFLGPQGAVKLLSNVNNPISAAQLMPAAAKSNPSIFLKNGRPLTPAGIYRRLSMRIGSHNYAIQKGENV